MFLTRTLKKKKILILLLFAVRLFFTYLLVVGELDGLHLLSAVLVVVEVVLDGERLEQLHRRLRPHLGDPVEEQDVLCRLASVVQLIRVKLWIRKKRAALLNAGYKN